MTLTLKITAGTAGQIKCEGFENLTYMSPLTLCHGLKPWNTLQCPPLLQRSFPMPFYLDIVCFSTIDA